MERYQAVVIGSGYGGSICAARLAAAGMTVLVVERGRRLAAGELRQTDDLKYIQSIVDVVVASDNVAFRTGKLVGGASIPMDGAHFRTPRKSFEARDAAGRPYWPGAYSRAALDPYYARAEAMLGIRQFGWHEVSRAGGLFAKMLDAAGASCDRARMNYTDCVHCGYCAQGCSFDKKNNMLRTYLPVAEAAGAVVRAGAEAAELEPSEGGYLVRLREGEPVWGERVIVAAGGIHSAALLLRSRRHLPRLSSWVGKGFNNNGEHAFLGILPPEFDELSRYWCFQGADNAAVMSFHWFEAEGFTLHPGGGFEPSVFSAAFEAADHPVLPRRAWGMEYKRFVESVYPHRVIGFSALGLADAHRDITVDESGRLDLPQTDRAAHDAYLDRLERIVLEVGARSGVTLFPAVPRKLSGQTSAHLLSACRMAERAEDGVVDPDGEVFGHENLYVCDASVVPYALGVNPALTISAIAERVSERIVASA
jgi:choline dehydrogenase-like flavoprotein